MSRLTGGDRKIFTSQVGSSPEGDTRASCSFCDVAEMKVTGIGKRAVRTFSPRQKIKEGENHHSANFLLPALSAEMTQWRGRVDKC